MSDLSYSEAEVNARCFLIISSMSNFNPALPVVWDSSAATTELGAYMKGVQEQKDIVASKMSSLETSLANNPKWGISQGCVALKLKEALDEICELDGTPTAAGAGSWMFTLASNISLEGGGAYPLPGVATLFQSVKGDVFANIVSATDLLAKADG